VAIGAGRPVRRAAGSRAGLARPVAVGGERSRKMTLLRLTFASLAWALEAARIFFVLCGCAVRACALRFGMGYRRGVDDADVPLEPPAENDAVRGSPISVTHTHPVRVAAGR
jgi:hypothetical protein